MKSLTRGHFKAGIDSLRGAKMRNFWTMLGVIIGVASVITVVGIGEGVKQQISGQVHRMGKGIITIRPASLRSGKSVVGSLAGPAITGALTARDVTTIGRTAGVSTVVPMSALGGSIQGDNGNYHDGLVIGTTAGLPSVLNQSMAYGVFLTDDDAGSNVAVLGQHAANALFNEDVPLGRSFKIHGQEFIVRGIFNQFPSAPLSEEADFDNAIFIPYDVAQSLTNNTAATYEIFAQATNAKQAAAVAKAVDKGLVKAHGGQTDFSVLQQNQNLAGSNSILDLLTRMIGGVAAISLLVGGIGIMNVMLVSVTERMHEIGIRKAIGATNRQILSQFLIESTVLSLVGGLLGIILAYFIDLAFRTFSDLQPVISWQVVLLATGVSLLVGIIFGSVPALKAARKEPIKALRSQ